MAPLVEIQAATTLAAGGVPVTAALGETSEWLDASALPALPPELACVKLGLAGMRRRPDWEADWIRVRTRFDAAAGAPLDWVAVVYADNDMADSPDAHAVIDAAAATGCRGVLIDTYSKSSGTLLTSVTTHQLKAWTAQTHEANLFLALAGRLSAGDLPQLSGVPAEIIAIRSAACPAGRRGGCVSAACVAAFKQCLQREFSNAEDRCDRRRRAGTA
jgi:uncharacterized protein (UPF0264 family)